MIERRFHGRQDYGFWRNSERRVRLAQLAAKGYSYTTMTAILNEEWGTQLTRNSIGGACDRLGLTAPRKPKPTKLAGHPPGQNKPSDGRHIAGAVRSRVRGNSQLTQLTPIYEPVEPAALAAHNAAIPLGQRKQLLELQNGRHCHWPVGDPGAPGFFFCGAATNGVYCDFHGRAATIGGSGGSARSRSGFGLF